MNCPHLVEHIAACTRAADEAVRLLHAGPGQHARAVRKVERLAAHLAGLLVEVQQ